MGTHIRISNESAKADLMNADKTKLLFFMDKQTFELKQTMNFPRNKRDRFRPSL